MADLDYPLSHGGAPVKVEELVLVRIQRTKPGTLQPVFKLWPQTVAPGRYPWPVEVPVSS